MKTRAAAHQPSLAYAYTLTVLILALAALASVVGFFSPTLYRDSVSVVAQAKGQDLVTFAFAIPAAAVALVLAARGSLRAQVAWLGFLGYFAYTYTSYAVLSAFNPMFLVYVALFSASVITLVTAGARVDAEAVRRRFGPRTPVAAVAAYLLLVSVVLAFLWLVQIIPATLSGQIPAAITEAQIPTNPIWVLDLGMVAPLGITAAVLLLKRRA